MPMYTPEIVSKPSLEVFHTVLTIQNAPVLRVSFQDRKRDIWFPKLVNPNTMLKYARSKCNTPFAEAL
jgi:hypothetical protein